MEICSDTGRIIQRDGYQNVGPKSRDTEDKMQLHLLLACYIYRCPKPEGQASKIHSRLPRLSLVSGKLGRLVDAGELEPACGYRIVLPKSSTATW
jgi:hypothetical protein